jgi:mannose/fructose/N-acetylgalactosamine-specific phosphotransferase system component IIB
MILTEGELRRIIRRALMEDAAAEEVTVGDVKKALKYAKGKKLKDAAIEISKEAGKKAAVSGVKSVLSIIPGLAGVADAVEKGMEIKDLYDAAMSANPEQKKKNPLWDMLTVDPDTSAIVDDGVEQEFVNSLADKVSSLPDDAKIPNADAQLKGYLKDKYSGAYVSKGGQ